MQREIGARENWMSKRGKSLPIGKRVTAIVALTAVTFALLPTRAENTLKERLRARVLSRSQSPSQGVDKYNIAGLDVAVWKPKQGPGKYPLVIFSHGYHGCNTQSTFIMDALARAGYLVMAPNHKDAIGNGSAMTKPEAPFKNASTWNENTFKGRGDDIKKLIDALHRDATWDARIDWTRVALAGHSLGGYTVLALGGAWRSWKLEGIKALLALSPYCEPLITNGFLGEMRLPVMYQGGTRDFGITPTIKRPDGAYSRTSSPAYFIEFDKVGHFSWTNFNHDERSENLISSYCIAFLDKYLKGEQSAKPDERQPGVETLAVK
jgi:dienelactone hydrolase